MSEITGAAKAHEAYAFACMRCGHGWEQAYDIEHHIDGSGREFVVYKAGGLRVPSPLSSPTCTNCGGHVVRIMKAGQVTSVHNLIGQSVSITGPLPSEPYLHSEPARKPKKAHKPEQAEPGQSAEAGQAAEPGQSEVQNEPGEPHHWHLSDLMHPFHRK
ncbi:hypothetical protein SLUN_16240 [Streptomyces lunaelactis]|uniref:C2H2-type domain-containing protein n=1 Tax=Streptomyces lunaelactis TaxID=1535768 RepID=A0A2R4T2Z7_9ACTN|nr:hypothetical protein [Streptomyces lunaelactis]AVZ73498.1 hypothetical protein SLUN_16240 [Streptomyces lunaelactis]NUK04222.1 hypothetical protein [Streptomyces lunaelactis]NUK18328.1 hypothetical protein [Streptomyces lunaelactis]NUK74630.1 hypothetical protein [Streptomyces lunaelactis]NUK78586.1 hypothetical protein [Streptomyces lunaelactis]